jgi:hypothetical protein
MSGDELVNHTTTTTVRMSARGIFKLNRDGTIQRNRRKQKKVGSSAI